MLWTDSKQRETETWKSKELDIRFLDFVFFSSPLIKPEGLLFLALHVGSLESLPRIIERRRKGN
jgi:hypothetical protein